MNKKSYCKNKKGIVFLKHSVDHYVVFIIVDYDCDAYSRDCWQSRRLRKLLRCNTKIITHTDYVGRRG